MSYRTLAAAVGVSHVTLRHHFGAKEELLAEVFDLIRAREPIPDDLSPGTDGSP
ncbi:TetR/AcrR family transcriptional regulator [Nocardioides limicola]|uniref:TetR/AcrR family transcriptional regulator n=1 Tax=Nocardioides limicola TaxID=2803368 RepID=UPI00355642B9